MYKINKLISFLKLYLSCTFTIDNIACHLMDFWFHKVSSREKVIGCILYIHILVHTCNLQISLRTLFCNLYSYFLSSPGNLTNEDHAGGWQNGPCSIPHQIHPSPQEWRWMVIKLIKRVMGGFFREETDNEVHKTKASVCIPKTNLKKNVYPWILSKGSDLLGKIVFT